MRKLMLRSQSGRRRPRYGPQLCAASAALLLLLISLSVLHSRLSSSPFHLVLPLLPHPHNSSSSSSDPPPSDGRMIDQLDRLADEDDDEILESDQLEDLPRSPLSGFFWDHAAAVARRSFTRNLPDPNNRNRLLPPPDAAETKTAFGSDDQPVDEGVRNKLHAIRHIEDALMLKTAGSSPLRDGWARWLEGKADFLRRDRMLRSNLELLIPKNHPLLQDPDMPGVTTLTRGDRLMQSAIWKELDNTPFPAAGVAGEVKRVDLRKPLNLQADRRRWGYFPGIDPHLSFSEFMDRFLGGGPCSINVFMVWNSPSWMYGVRHQRGLESLLYHHKDACVVMFSETMELDFFQDFVNDGYRVAVVMPNLDELLQDTPTSVFASVWYEWRKTKHYPVHYSELVRLAALYKYGGVYLDSDIIVLKALYSLESSVGVEDQIFGNSVLNGAVMAFERHSPFLMECLVEFYSTYDDTRLRWNGADLLTRVIKRFRDKGSKSDGQHGILIGPPIQFFPISSTNITRYFVSVSDEIERSKQDVLLNTILNESITFHFWNGLTSALVPEPNSLVGRLLNRYCLHCIDVL